ncbi:hypothetical protein LCGC14_0386790 [marine sediment metagenome]|uniref:Uncharacterized protein n=1 Tax=marine sediment metagenome TaxID=412755 RepID=A0A0F9VMV8_9ZZZZ
MMANRRLWIVDSKTGDRILLAKGWGEEWVTWPAGRLNGGMTFQERLNSWFELRDVDFNTERTDESALRLEAE